MVDPRERRIALGSPPRICSSWSARSRRPLSVLVASIRRTSLQVVRRMQLAKLAPEMGERNLGGKGEGQQMVGGYWRG